MGGQAQETRTKMFSDVEAYDRFMGHHSRVLAPLFVEFVGGIQNGDRVLDVGCGTGSLAFTIARTAEPSKIAGLDLSVPFIEYARSVNTDSGVAFDIGDAQELPYPDASFDKSLSLLVIGFVPDPSRAVAEMRRVTRPGGMVALCHWDTTSGMELFSLFWKAAAALDPSADTQRENQRASNFRTKEGAIPSLLVEAGITEVEETALTIPLYYASFDDLWSPIMRGVGPQGAYMTKLSPEHKEALRDRFRSEVLKGKPDGPFALNARAWAARGKVTG